mgnify:FL=1
MTLVLVVDEKALGPAHTNAVPVFTLKCMALFSHRGELLVIMGLGLAFTIMAATAWLVQVFAWPITV